MCFLSSLKENAFVTTGNSNTNSTLKIVLLFFLTKSHSYLGAPKFGAG